MYKSRRVFTFGLLMSSLVMLAIIPLLNYSSFSPREAKAESEYGLIMDDNYKSKYSSFEKKEVIECNNINVNNNGFNGATLQPALNGLVTDEAQASDEGEIAASGNDAGRASGSDTDFKVVCINNNNGGNATEPTEPTEPTATLAVSKTVTCNPNDISTRAAEACQNIAIALPPNEFNIVVTGNNPKPSEFPGSSVPVVVTLGAGNYEVTEEEAPILPFPGVTTTVTTNFSGD